MATVQGLVFVLSGPSGAGKTTVARWLRDEGFPLTVCVTATTRPPRQGETPGVSYHFCSLAEFQRMQAEGELLEWAEVYGNWYGTPRREVVEALRKGTDALVTVDIRGALSLREVLRDPVLIFLAPPSLDAQLQLLRRRDRQMDEQELRARLAAAPAELEHLSSFDYQIINYPGRLDETAEALKAIITAERRRVHPRWVTLEAPDDA